MPDRILLEYTGYVLAHEAYRARTLDERSAGLLAGPPLKPGQALILERSPQVHTFGMKYAIDVVFCDKAWKVVHVVHGMRPSRLTRWVWFARYCVELPAGAAASVRKGDRLFVEPVNP